MKNAQLLMMSNSGEGLGYGYLYNWYAINDVKFAPADWKVVEDAEFSTLVTFLGGFSIVGGKLKERGTNHWLTENITNPDSGFNWFGGSLRDQNGLFLTGANGLKGYGSLYINDPTYKIATTLDTVTSVGFIAGNQNKGASVRLLYTGAGTPTTMIDYDGNVYDVVLIGTQYWTVQNWKCTSLNDGTPLTKVTGDAAWAALTTEGYCAYNNDEGNV